MKEWIKVALTLVKIARGSNLLEKKVAVKEIFGSNLRLASRALAGEPQNQWAALCAAHEMVSKKPRSMVLVRLFDEIRTFFERNWRHASCAKLNAAAEFRASETGAPPKIDG